MLTNRKYSGRRPLVVVAALLSLMILLPLAGCKNDTVPEPTRYTVKFDKNAKDATGEMASQTFIDGIAQKLTANGFSRPDYGFAGWAESTEGTVKYSDREEITVTKDITLYAKWTPVYTVTPVTFTPADGTTLYYGDTVTLATATEGATIQYKLGDGSWQDYTVGTPISVTTSTTITAKATKAGLKDSAETKASYNLKRYTVTFDTNGGSAVASQVVESGKVATKPEPAPTKDGWTFQGWYEDSGLTKEFDFSTQVTADTPLYAKWRANPGTVVSDGLTINGVKLASTSEVQVLSTAVDLSSLVVDGVNSEVFISGRSGTIDPFVMGQYEVTQQLYLAVMGEWGGTAPSDTYGAGDEYPAYYVSWYDAVVFCNELTKKVLGEDACVYYSDGSFKTVYTKGDGTSETIPYMDSSKSGYRLPTEAEWELAARGGDPGAPEWKYTYAGSNTIGDVAWYTDNSESKTHQVGEKTANSLNLHDMSGNVWEWCWDWYGDIAPATPPSGGASGIGRVGRGGGWSNHDDICSVSYLNVGGPHYRYSYLGFRVVHPSSK